MTDYQVVGRLGQRLESIVHKVRGPDEKEYAAKVGFIRPNEAEIQDLVYRASKLAPQPHVCGTDFILMEVIDGEPMDVWLGKRTPRDLKKLIKALDEFYGIYRTFEDMCVRHNDLGWSPILMTDVGMRVIDYGLSRYGTVVWNDYYMPVFHRLVRRLCDLTGAKKEAVARDPFGCRSERKFKKFLVRMKEKL